jgi:hypothetical protein
MSEFGCGFFLAAAMVIIGGLAVGSVIGNCLGVLTVKLLDKWWPGWYRWPE